MFKTIQYEKGCNKKHTKIRNQDSTNMLEKIVIDFENLPYNAHEDLQK